MKIESGIKIGREKIVLLMPKLGIVVKLPRIRFVGVIKSVIHNLLKGDWLRLKTHFKRAPTIPEFSYWYPILSGIVTNFSEFWYYATTWNPFLQPTYFSLFGLINIQRYGEPCTMPQQEFRNELERIVGQKYMWDSHHFINPANFCLTVGKMREKDSEISRVRLRMHDYGTPRSQAVVTICGYYIYREFRTVPVSPPEADPAKASS